MTESEKPVRIKSILVPVDGSTYSERALKYACLMAGPLQAEVIVLHVVPMLVSAATTHDTSAPHPYLTLQKVGEDIIARAKLLADRLGCRITEMMLHGEPASQIIAVAQEKNVDLIIMGSRGMGTIKRILVGSNSDRVIRQASCPVMVVR
ncbi:MAG: universal stress protein [Candidatus Thorarchaeota archaeon]